MARLLTEPKNLNGGIRSLLDNCVDAIVQFRGELSGDGTHIDMVYIYIHFFWGAI